MSSSSEEPQKTAVAHFFILIFWFRWRGWRRGGGGRRGQMYTRYPSPPHLIPRHTRPYHCSTIIAAFDLRGTHSFALLPAYSADTPAYRESRMPRLLVWPFSLLGRDGGSPGQVQSRTGWCVAEDEVMALGRLSLVMRALTPRHVDVVVCLAKKLRDNPECGGEM